MNATQNPTLPRAARLALLAASIVLAIGSIVVAISTRGAQVEPAVLEQAEIAYAKGLERAALDPASARAAFLESASLIASAIERSDSALLRYNRANALLQAGELGEAIAEYRKAGSLAPSDERIAANLAEARSKVARSMPVAKPGLLARAGSTWGVVDERIRWIAALAALWTGVILLLLLGARARGASIALLLIGCVLSATVIADGVRRSEFRIAVVQRETVLRKGNGDGFEPVLASPLPVGTECVPRETRPGWIEVELGDGTRGWIADSALVGDARADGA
jgi:hypothetical protein